MCPFSASTQSSGSQALSYPSVSYNLSRAKLAIKPTDTHKGHPIPHPSKT
jgi:hypothetical protein